MSTNRVPNKILKEYLPPLDTYLFEDIPVYSDTYCTKMYVLGWIGVRFLILVVFFNGRRDSSQGLNIYTENIKLFVFESGSL